jgi:multicomponent Na+:H+ antiporter subunit E
VHATRYPRGPARNAFASLSSLLPGTVPVRDDAQGLLYHCLDVDQPVAAELAAEEAAVSRVLPQTIRA